MPRHLRHLILLYPLLLVALLSYPQQRHRDTLILHFAFNSHRIPSQDSTRLSQALASEKIDSVQIDGYTDKVGSAAYNLALSRRRAKAASRLISRETVDDSRLHAAGHGKAPTTQWSDSANRRVEVVLFYTRPPEASGTPPAATGRPASTVPGSDSIEV